MKKVVLVAAGLIVGLAVFVLIALGPIWLRLHRNQPAAETLAAAMAAKYPGYRIHGVASYELEVIYISVWAQPDKPTREQMRDWLAAERSARQIAADGLLRFHDPKGTAAEIEMEF